MCDLRQPLAKLRGDRAAGLGRLTSVLRSIRAWRGNEDGATIITVALTLPALIGMMGLAVEISYWYWNQRAMQNAADTAAIAAATNAGANYDAEARAVASQYGYQATHVAVSNTSPAPGCTANCYTVTVSNSVPLFLSSIIGYSGNGRGAADLATSAIATWQPAYEYCVLALGASGKEGITSDGASKADLHDCNTMSNTTSTCNGSNLNAAVGDSAGANKNCGNVANSGASRLSDPYSCSSGSSKWLASCITPPADTCKAGGGYQAYPQAPKKHGDKALPAANLWSGSYALGGYRVVCGDQQLTADTTMNGGVLVIMNGNLDTNGYKLSGTGLTVVFSGTNDPSYSHIPTGGGTLDIAAPTSGTWSGMAIYQDPKLTTNVDMSAAGNSPTWNLSGLVYLPHSSVQLSGAVNKSSSGPSCFAIVVDNIRLNGTASIFSKNNDCRTAGGLIRPEGGHRALLVH